MSSVVPLTTASAGSVPGSTLRAQARAALPSRWGAGFVGVVIYLVVEYSRLPAMYPILQPLQLGKVGIIVALLGLLFAPPQDRRLVGSRVRYVAEACLIAFLGASIISTLIASDQGMALDSIFLLVNFLVVYHVISRSVSTPWRLRAFLVFFFLLNFKMAQFVVRSYNVAMATSSRTQMQLVSNGFGAGGTGFFGNSADLGVAMNVVWPLATVLIFSEYKGWKRVLLVICSLMFLGAILLCGSRGAIVGAVGVAVVSILKSSKKLVALVLLLLLLPGIVYVMPEASKERMIGGLTDPEHDKTAAQRLALWHAGRLMFERSPLLGVGPNNFGTEYGRHYLDTRLLNDRVSWVPHSMYIEAISQWGIIGCAPLLLLAVCIFRINSLTRKSILKAQGKPGKSTFEYCLTVGLDLGFIGYLISGAFVAVLLYPHIFIVLALSAGVQSSVLARDGAPAVLKAVPVRKFAPVPENLRA